MTLSIGNTEIAFRSQSSQSLRGSYWLFRLMKYPGLVRWGTRIVETSLKLGLPIEPVIKATIFRQFCGGETIEECGPTIERLDRFSIGTILDYSVEAAQTEASFEQSSRELLRTVELASRNKRVPFCVFKSTALARFELLERLAAGKSLNNDEKREWESSRSRIETLCQTAFEKGVRIFIDAEESWIQSPIDDLAMEFMERFNRQRPCVFNTLQMYRVGRLEYLRECLERARRGGFFLGLKLVRGAYMDKERERARTLGLPSPILPDKAGTDREYDSALRLAAAGGEHVALCAGTHNESSTLLLTQLMDKSAVARGDERFWFAQLLGMSDHLTYNLASEGYRVAKYVPFGPVRSVMPYLFRRAEENTSVTGQTTRELSLIAAELERRKRSNGHQ